MRKYTEQEKVAAREIRLKNRREARLSRIASGLCSTEGCNKKLVTKSLCGDCAARYREIQNTRLLSGLCVTGCGRPLFSKRMCKECSERVFTAERFRVTSGLCSKGCGRKLTTKWLCQQCHERYLIAAKRRRETLRQARIKSGLCDSGCGRPLKSHAKCAVCIARRKTGRIKRLEGKCYRKGCELSADGGLYCSSCKADRFARAEANRSLRMSLGLCTSYRCDNPLVTKYHCRKCADKANSYRRSSNREIISYDDALKVYGARCGACGTDRPGGKGIFCVDHCHVSGKVRGLLCNACNLGIGLLGDSADSIRKALHYLQRFESKIVTTSEPDHG